MKVSSKDIPFIKRNLHLTDEHLGNIFGVTAGGVRQARRRFGMPRPSAKFVKGIGGPIKTRFKPGHPFYPPPPPPPPWKIYIRKRRCLIVKGFFELGPEHRKDKDYWLKLIL